MTVSHASRALGLAIAAILAAPLAHAEGGGPLQLLPPATQQQKQSNPPPKQPAANQPTAGKPAAGAGQPSAGQPAQPRPGTVQPVQVEVIPAPAPQPQPAPAQPAAAKPAAAEANQGQPAQGQPPSARPSGGTAAPAQPQQPSNAGPAPKIVRTEKLAPAEADSLGTLDRSNGGLGDDLWRGMTRTELATLIAALPDAVPSPAFRDLQRRILLTRAAAPQGAEPGGPSLAVLRARKLAAMGRDEDLRNLLALLPSQQEDEGLTRIRIEAGLLSGNSNVCEDIKSLIHRYQDVFWQKALIFCQFAAGKRDDADMGLGLLREQGGDNDPAFDTLAQRLDGDKQARVASMPSPTPLLVAMSELAKEPLPADLPNRLPPMITVAVAKSPYAAPETRLAAAEAAASLGLIGADELTAAYEKVQVATADLANAYSRAQAQYGPHARALLFRAAKAQRDPAGRAEILKESFELARAGGAYPIAVQANLALLMGGLEPSPDLASFAPEAAKALYFAGQPQLAEGWAALARQSSKGADAAVELAPYASLAGSRSASWDDRAAAAWRKALQSRKDVAPEVADERAARLYGLLAALGDKVPDSLWQPLYGQTQQPGPSTMPSPALWHAFVDAAAAGRRGEAVIALLAALGGRAPQEINPVALDAAIAALRGVGLNSEARQLAIEAAVAWGL